MNDEEMKIMKKKDCGCHHCVISSSDTQDEIAIVNGVKFLPLDEHLMLMAVCQQEHDRLELELQLCERALAEIGVIILGTGPVDFEDFVFMDEEE